MSGYITTCGAAIFLWNCQSSFFQIFGTFLCTVVTWSVLFAHFFFMPLLSIAGPDHVATTSEVRKKDSKESIPVDVKGATVAPANDETTSTTVENEADL
jgi:hypothetical protein